MAKILVFSPEHLDYLCDLTYHGLISLGGHEVYSNTDKSYMFSNYQKATMNYMVGDLTIQRL